MLFHRPLKLLSACLLGLKRYPDCNQHRDLAVAQTIRQLLHTSPLYKVPKPSIVDFQKLGPLAHIGPPKMLCSQFDRHVGKADPPILVLAYGAGQPASTWLKILPNLGEKRIKPKAMESAQTTIQRHSKYQNRRQAQLLALPHPWQNRIWLGVKEIPSHHRWEWNAHTFLLQLPPTRARHPHRAERVWVSLQHHGQNHDRELRV